MEKYMFPKRTIYLQTVSPEEAVRRAKSVLERKRLIKEETIASQNACGRVLSRGVHALHSSPTFHSAAMDGYAVNARDTFAAREGHPLSLFPEQNCFAVNTGQPLPEGCDAVIMIEQTVQKDGHILIESPVFPWQHVRRIGEDIVATELLFPRNHLLRPWDIGALLSGGIWDVPVWERLSVRIIPTGDEVLDFLDRPHPDKGQVIESNSQMLAALFREKGCLAERMTPVQDDPEALRQALLSSLRSDSHLTVFCAGSSAGSKDFTRSVLEKEGEILAHGIAVMPGKPSLLALCQGKLVVGVPGYPVSALVCFKELLDPIITWLMHKEPDAKTCVPVELTRSIPSRIGMEEHIQTAIGRVGSKLVGTPLSRGAGNITTVTRAQGIIRISPSCEGFNEQETVMAELSVPETLLDKILVCIGSHDNTLDLLADELMGLPEPVQLVSGHVGSTGGITALANGACHLSGMHLFDPVTDDFNFPFLKKFLPKLDVTVINLAIRHQGLIVAPGNPLHIQSLQDLTQVRFINRQKGAGTRVLLDWKLAQAGIKTSSIQGYEKEENTHMAVAANIMTGAADCGMGIYAAAKALHLDFIPLALERYDLVIPTCFLQDPRIQAVLNLLASPAFQKRIESQGGYDTPLTGQVMQPGIKGIS